MTSPILAALLVLVLAVYIVASQRKIAAGALALAFITLGYISGNNTTTFGSWIQNVVDGFTAVINWIASAF